MTLSSTGTKAKWWWEFYNCNVRTKNWHILLWFEAI